MPTTLIVDDDLDMRLLVRMVIEAAHRGLTVVGEAGDGEEALRVFDALGPPEVPDVVVLDNRMPKKNGMEVAEDILRRFPNQAVILYSAFFDSNLQQQARELGIAACLSKNEVEQLPGLIHSLSPPRN